jgi:dihydrofolate reductase
MYMCAASADGYIAESDGGLEWLFGAAEDPLDPDADHAEYDRFIAGVGALCMGADTYEIVLGEKRGWQYADRPAWVFTHRELPVPDGADVRFVSGPPGDVHGEMLDAAGKRDLWLVGGGQLASQFADDGLIDELILTLVPVMLGTGIPLFARRVPGDLSLVSSRTLPGDLVEARYAFGRA